MASSRARQAFVCTVAARLPRQRQSGSCGVYQARTDARISQLRFPFLRKRRLQIRNELANRHVRRARISEACLLRLQLRAQRRPDGLRLRDGRERVSEYTLLL